MSTISYDQSTEFVLPGEPTKLEILVLEKMHEGYGLRKSRLCDAEGIFYITRTTVDAMPQELIKAGTIKSLVSMGLIEFGSQFKTWYTLSAKGKEYALKGKRKNKLVIHPYVIPGIATIIEVNNSAELSKKAV